MSVSIPVSTEIKTRLDKIRRPGESYQEVIEKLLDDHDEGDLALCSGWAKRAKEAISEFRKGETLTEEDIIKKYALK
ncbi:putative CopG family antitoxin [Methanocalculus alkaliphilus]|uniref:DUF7557 family protein n=1 Tax=Methanocalculus alkaliphilus TaxID=768730 RepID=UPI00209EDECE|nr:antitoxin VapB family protein [Methanocalculus alkaliphilus]MCP1715322.1 putative CopG family antitoxin [Methanocalculus alkaliphilus]